MADKDPVAILNELCQKNSLNYCYEKIKEYGQAHEKRFVMRLLISRQGDKNSIEFKGEGANLKAAKKDAAITALQVDFIKELKKLISGQLDSVNVKYNTNAANCSFASNTSMNSVGTTSSISSLSSQMSKITIFNDEKNKLHDAWVIAKKFKLPMNIEFLRKKKGFTNSTIQIKLHLGIQSHPGKGSTDMEAILDAVDAVNFEDCFEELKDGQNSSSDEEGSHKVVQLHELHQQLDKKLEFTCLSQSGPAQDPLFVFKCQFGDLITYGLAKNKKSSKNKSAIKMLDKLNESVQIENVKIQTYNLEKWKEEKYDVKIQNILNSNENAISLLEQLDKTRTLLGTDTLKFTESAKEIGVQIHFTADCKLLHGPDLKIRTEDFKDCVRKNDLLYLKSSSRSTKKKTAKMEAAEKMVNLLRGLGAHTNKEVEINNELQKFKDTSLCLKEDKTDNSGLSIQYQAILAIIAGKAVDFLKDKPDYNNDYDYLAELQDIEFEYRGQVILSTRSSKEVYKIFANCKHEPYIDCLVNFSCGIVLSGYAKDVDEMEAKNKAAYDIFKKLVSIKDKFN